MPISGQPAAQPKKRGRGRPPKRSLEFNEGPTRRSSRNTTNKVTYNEGESDEEVRRRNRDN